MLTRPTQRGRGREPSPQSRLWGHSWGQQGLQSLRLPWNGPFRNHLQAACHMLAIQYLLDWLAQFARLDRRNVNQPDLLDR
jgi:hypothetical protein